MDDRQRDISQEQPPAEATNPDPATTQAPSPTEPVPGEPPPVSEVPSAQSAQTEISEAQTNPAGQGVEGEKEGPESKGKGGANQGQAKESGAARDGESQKSREGGAEELSAETERAIQEASTPPIEATAITELPPAAIGDAGHGMRVADEETETLRQAAHRVGGGTPEQIAEEGYERLPPEQQQKVNHEVALKRVEENVRMAVSQKTPDSTPVVATQGKEGPGGPSDGQQKVRARTAKM